MGNKPEENRLTHRLELDAPAAVFEAVAIVAEVVIVALPFEAVAVVVVSLLENAAAVAKAVVLPFEAMTVVVVPLSDSAAVATKAVVHPLKPW